MENEQSGAPEGVTEDTTVASQVEGDEAQQDADPGDDAAAETEGQGEPQGRPRKSVQERIDELTAKQRQAEREAEYWRAEAQRQQQRETQSKAQPAEDGEPNPADYQYGDLDAAFIRDHATYHARRAFREEQQRAEKEREARTIEAGWHEARAKAAQGKPDFYEVVDRGNWPCTEAMADAIRTSQDGGELAYHLAKNPDEARRIAALNPISQIREIGRLEASLATKPQPNRASGAPPPPNTQVRGAGGRFTVAPDTDDFAAFEKQYGS